MASKPTLAVFKFASCDGCQLSILDVDVSLTVNHTWVGDLIVTLEHQNTGTFRKRINNQRWHTP